MKNCNRKVKKGKYWDKTHDGLDDSERAEVEHRFSQSKRTYGMQLITIGLIEVAAHVIAMSILVLNIR